MKRYKFIGDFKTFPNDGTYAGAVVGEVYGEKDELPEELVYGLNVKYYVESYPSDWELVAEEEQDDEEVVNQLVDDFMFDLEGAKEFLSKFNEMKRVFNIDITVYQAAQLIETFK